MKLDRNINADGKGKYAIIKLRGLDIENNLDVQLALETLEKHQALDWGNTPQTEFFLIRLKDKYAEAALLGYASAANFDDNEYASEIFDMASRAGEKSPWCKKPD